MELREKNIRLTFYGGANEIGWNKILLEDLENDVKVFIDFRINNHKLTEYKKFYGNPSILEDLIKLKILPPEETLPIENLYSTYFIFEEGKKFRDKMDEFRGKSDPPGNFDGV